MRSVSHAWQSAHILQVIKSSLEKIFSRPTNFGNSSSDRDTQSVWSPGPQSNCLFSYLDVSDPAIQQDTGILKKKMELAKLGPVVTVGIHSNECDGKLDDLYTMNAEAAKRHLRQYVSQAKEGTILLFYVPHPFCSSKFQDYHYLPTWKELFTFFDGLHQVEIVQYSTSIDPAGRYFFAVRKANGGKSTSAVAPECHIARQVFRVFYYPYGADLRQGHSSRALSSHLCHALESRGGTVYAYGFQDTEKLDAMNRDDVLVGHVGPWVREAYDRGFRRIILYNPANRWYTTRNSPVFETNATLGEQVNMARMVIAQSGSIWRLTAENHDPEKWRWIDLGVDQCLFPRLKTTFAPRGERRICAINLYNDHEKGADIAKSLAKQRPSYRFIWIAGKDPGLPNVAYYRFLSNTSSEFRDLIGNCDFIIAPSREDAQPGTVVEAMALGLIPVVSYSSGYSIGVAKAIMGDSVEEWLEVIDFLQQAPEPLLVNSRSQLDRYLAYFHNWTVIEEQICFYMLEYFAHFDV